MGSKQILINKIIPLSTVDGPGARTSIYVQGCNLKCGYCHNPETINMCIHCGKCIEVCPVGALKLVDKKVTWNEDTCIDCDKCIETCPYLASPKTKAYSPEDLMAEVRKNMPFIRGITLSGGEASLYPEFLKDLFSLAHEEKLTCFLDYNGKVDLSKHLDLMEYVDGVMVDVKAWDDEKFKRLTGGTREVPLVDTIKYLLETKKLYEIRIVHQEDFVDTENALRQIKSSFPKNFADIKIKLIAYRNHNGRLFMKDIPSTKVKDLKKFESLAKNLGYKYVIIK
ncbi:YjjW family glycine radical enzyme activase [Neofamilia massiliensis]|uniref:YjjW family glycine radical enzyme activase n=1 Tax=Neofamilia massiliensis TaxID=1673724 RepID=UPI0006BB828A|nr:YjjW family glycine radical enzyme activase [Neofamilia massiliensis]